MVCGTDKSQLAWRSVPLLQAQYQLNVILQSLGFLNARFEIKDSGLHVWKGLPAKFERFRLTGTNGVVTKNRKRKVINHRITPQKLDEVKAWAELAARRQGHACPVVRMTAEVWTKTLVADIEPGPSQIIDQVIRTGHENLDPASLRRFEAFRQGQRYSVLYTQITADRLMGQGIFQNAYITPVCRGDKVDLQVVTETGKPRLLRFSLGASTEEFPFGDIWFRNSRLDDRASNFSAKLHASPRRQSLDLNSELFVIHKSYTTFLGPRFRFERRKEPAYETEKIEGGADLGRGWDIRNMRIDAKVGPTLNFANTITGEGPSEKVYLSWDGHIQASSHAYEAFVRNQFEGWTGEFDYSGQRSYLGSNLNVDRYDFKFKHLFNLNGYSPPLFVIASRLEGILVDVPPDQILELPVDMRIFYGGNDNIRGFSRQSLNNNNRGYLSALLAGFELRIVEELPYRVEPFLLWDGAKLGAKQRKFMQPAFTSYGGGVRWASPFGTLRGSAARGKIINGNIESRAYPEEWIYFISFGQEF